MWWMTCAFAGPVIEVGDETISDPHRWLERRHSPRVARWWTDEDVIFEQVLVDSPDGAQIPVSLLRPAAVTPGPQTPVWLQAYGGFGVSQMRGRTDDEALFLEAGGIVATVHARGGLERGEDWRQSSTLEHIDRTFEDVLTVARWFVEQGISSPGRLALSGSSNGGLTTAAVVARQPELFGAAIGHAGVYDLLRAEHFGRWWPREYGTLQRPEQAERLLAESPVHRVPQGKLPPMLVITGAHDPVVDPAHSFKLAAAWSALPGGPVLLRVDAFGSHGAKQRKGAEFGPIAYDAAHDETMAFLFQALGMEVPLASDPLPPEAEE